MHSQLDRSAYEALGDPLSSATRTAKKSVYVFTSLCIIAGYTGVVPHDPSILGFRFPGLTEHAIRCALVILAAFSLISFLAGLVPDILRYVHLVDSFNLKRAGEMDSAIHTDPYSADEEEFRSQEFQRMTGYRFPRISGWLIVWARRIRFFLDTAFPIIYTTSGLVYFASR